MSKINLLDPAVSYGDGVDGLVIRQDQEITDEFLKSCADARFESNRRSNEFHMAASIPTIVVEMWQRQGFDVMKEPISACLARLRAEGLDAFITTNKTV